MSKNGRTGGEKPERLQGEAAPPDTKSWYEHIWKTQQETPARLEEAAKFLSGVISITLTLFLTVGKDSFENVRLKGRAGLATGLWLLSLVLCVLAIFPRRYRYSDIRVDTMKEMHRQTVRYKYAMLVGAVVLFLTALVILTWLFFDTRPG